VGLMGSFVVGLANAPFWTLAPLYAAESGLDTSGIALFMAAAIIGGAVAMWPIGRLSDRTDRRRVIVALSIGAAIGEIALVMTGNSGSLAMILLAGVLFGVFGLTLYSVCVAHMNDHGQSENFVAISGGLLIVYSVGSIIGPIIASIGVSAYGMASIFIVTCTIHIAFAIYTGWRVVKHPALSNEERSDFVVVPVSLAQPTELDPRAADEPPASSSDDGEVQETAP